jgi:flagellar motility protein MotE (MotC chaperone)
MVVAAIAFGVRVSDMVKNLSRAGSIEAYASEAGALNNLDTAAGSAKAAEPDKITAEDTAKKEDTKTEASKKPEIEVPSLEPAPTAKKEQEWKDSGDLDDEYSDVKMELFADLSKRRKDLEAKEKEIVMREALLKAAQAELEQKTEELTKIKTDIEGLLKQQTDQENQRITSLVKIYEGMKAKDAARIFDSLEMDVLLQVMTRMSERKSAPILAAMDADRARNLTILLAEQSKLPEIPALPTP